MKILALFYYYFNFILNFFKKLLKISYHCINRWSIIGSMLETTRILVHCCLVLITGWQQVSLSLYRSMDHHCFNYIVPLLGHNWAIVGSITLGHLWSNVGQSLVQFYWSIVGSIILGHLWSNVGPSLVQRWTIIVSIILCHHWSIVVYFRS